MSFFRKRTRARSRFHLDTPARATLATLVGEIRVAGWYLTPDGRAADRVIVRIGRRTLVCAPHERPDVLAAHPDRARDATCGFHATFTTRPGLKRLQIVAEHDGQSHPIATRLVRFRPGATVRLPLAPPSAQTEADAERAKRALKADLTHRLAAFFRRRQTLDFPPASDRPRLSVLIVVWNQAALTLACLQSLRDVMEDLDCEILVADNASTDESPRLWSAVRGIRVFRHDTNQGFLLAVNQLAKNARGDHLLLLNNDTTLGPRALHHALESIGRKPGVGAVGGRVILPTGLIQEAGNVIWRDGSCRGYGRGLAPDDPRVMDWKYTDYVSGVFLLTPRAVFERLNGFDETLAPAYYEDTDYCVRLWKHGLTVAYDPRIIVHHHEFGSAVSTDASIRLQQTNRERFVTLHRDWLAAQPDPHLTPEVPACRASAYQGQVLVIEDGVPSRHFGAGAPRMIAILEHLVARGRKVAFYPLTMPSNDAAWFTEHFNSEVRVLGGLGQPHLEDYLRRHIADFDLLWISRPHNMEFSGKILPRLAGAATAARIIYDAEAVYAVRDIKKATLTGNAPDPATADRLVQEELAIAAPAREIVAVSREEARLFEAAHGDTKTVHVLAHTIGDPPPPATAFEERRGLLFIGRLTDDDSPNVDSLLWFLNEVYPLIDPAARPSLDIIGDCRSPALARFRSDTVRFLGPVDHLAPCYHRARVFIAPTRFAAGIPLKLVEAAAHRLPAVCTPLLAGQLGWTHGTETLAGATPTEFAAHCLRLHEDRQLWETVRDNTRAHYDRHFSAKNFADTLDNILAAPR